MIPVIDLLVSVEARIPNDPVNIAKIKNAIMVMNRSNQLRPPSVKDNAISGILATINTITRTTADPTFPRMIARGDITVVSRISKVCRSFSQEIAVAVITGINSAMIPNSIAEISGNRVTNA